MFNNEAGDTNTRPTLHRHSSGLQYFIDGRIFRALLATAPSTLAGHLHLRLPSGRSATLGSRQSNTSAYVHVTTYAALLACLWRGGLGFAEGFISGAIKVDNLHSLFRFFLDNRRPLTKSSRRLPRVVWLDRLLHWRRANTRAGSRKNIAAHYDLGNDFYRLWLDPGMTYSSALYATTETSLEIAQSEKYEAIVAALGLAHGHSLLEIGCGWGGFAALAASQGATVDAITISREQYAATKTRMHQLGFDNSARVHFQDYRDTSGQFDRIASIEMIEAVGEQHWPTYFKAIHDRLKPGGCAVIQSITLRQDLFESYRRRPDFIQHYIFPGGMLPTVELIRHHTEGASLKFEQVQTFGPSYARTLAEWQLRFDQAWPQIESLGFDDRFRRMWHYYFAYCEVGFQQGTVDVGLYRLRKPPLT